MEELTLDSMIKVVQQPEHSKQKLIAYQKKYEIDTVKLVGLLKEGIPLPISEQELRDWQFQWDMFLATDGEILELLEEDGFDTPLLLTA